MANMKLLTITGKQETVLSGRRGENMVTWSLLPFAVCRKRDAKSLHCRSNRRGKEGKPPRFRDSFAETP